MPGPLDIRRPYDMPFEIIRRDRETPETDNRPHAPQPSIHEDWRRYPENQTPGDLNPERDPDDNGDGSVNIDHTVWKMTEALREVFH